MRRQAVVVGMCGMLLLAVSAAAQTAVTTSGGTTNTVPLYTGSATVGNSVITQSDGNVGIGTASPGAALDVANGAIRAEGDIIPGGNGVLRAIVPLAMAGGETNITSSNWQRVTRTTYTSIAQLFAGTPTLPGATREYFLVIRKGDNVNNQTDFLGSAWRFACEGTWNGGTDIPGYGFTLTEDWGQPDEGPTDWVAIPPTAVTQGCPSPATQYWKIDAKLVHVGTVKVMSVSMAAVDVYGGTTPAYSQAASGNDGFAPLSILDDNVWATGPYSGGNVGIGTATPTAKLEGDGNIKLTSGSGASITFADGSVQSTAYTGVACGGDYAESVDVTGDRRHYGPGDLLVLDPDHPGEVLKSARPYSTRIAGIYSTKPGYVGRRQTGPKGPDEVPMAMVGIVSAHATTENGPIHVGDLLVSSSTPGYAMKGTDRNRMLGAVVGKAAGNLESGNGVIEVLVTLQ